tara:strand:- start:1783 stop:2130 length:348 start_codon:yes stop_codon:yes gene_type:complete
MATANIICVEGSDLDGAPSAILRIDNRGSVGSLEADLIACFTALSSVPGDPGELAAAVCTFYDTTMSTVDVSVAMEADWDVSTMVMLSTERSGGMPVGQVLIPSTGDVSPLDLGV